MIEKLTYDDFLESLRLSPRLTIELVVINNDGQILLVKRNIEPFKNYWHLPGGFLLKGETISECFTRLSVDELGVPLDYSKATFEGLFENIKGDPRGHILHYVTKIKVDSIPNGHFFDNLPEAIIPFQKDFLNKIGIN